MFTAKETQAIKNGYIAAIYFTETGDTDQPGPDAVLSPTLSRHIDIEIAEFLDAIKDFSIPSMVDLDQVGIDFWLTRNRHGTGFWDHEQEYGAELAKDLTNVSQSFGETWVYENDQGQIDI